MTRNSIARTVLFILLASIAIAAQAPPAPIRSLATRDFTLVVNATGAVFGWGPDADGQMAKPPSPRRVTTEPTLIDLPGKVLQVALGATTQYALLEDGTVVAWGTNDEGQLGNGPMGASGQLGVYPKPSITPVRVTGLTDIIQIGTGLKHAVALKKDGTVWAWGRRDNGEIGDGKPAGRPLRAIGPTRVPGVDGITQIAVDGTHNLALRSDGRVMAWGSNNDGQLGNGTRDAGWIATPVSNLDRVVSIAVGMTFGGSGSSGAVRADGTVWMWGTNTSSQMGNGAGPMSPDEPGGRNLVPVQVQGVTGAKSISIGNGHVAALLGDGTLRMWGHNGFGELGVTTSGSSYGQRPVRTGITNVARVFLGGTHSVALKTDGTLWIWGNQFVSRGTSVLSKNLRVPTRLDLP